MKGGKDKNESKNKPQTPQNTFHPNKDKCDRPNSSRGLPLQTVLSCPRQTSKEREVVLVTVLGFPQTPL